MRLIRTVLIVAFALGCGFSICNAQHSTSTAKPMKHLLFLGEEKGYRHEAVSHAMATIERLGRENGLWTTTIRTDTEVLTKKKLSTTPKRSTISTPRCFTPAAILR